MIQLFNIVLKHKIVISILLLIGLCNFSQAQITGPTAVDVNNIYRYEFNNGLIQKVPSWVLTGGSGIEVATGSSGTTYYVDVQWTSAGTASVTFKDKTIVRDVLTNIVVSVPPPSASTLTNQNYIRTKTPRIATTNPSLLGNNEKIESVSYFDGLGRSIQNVGVRAGGNSEDVITHFEYDAYGRQDKDYLPYTASTNGGLYRTDGLTATNTYYNASTYEPDFPSVSVNDINAYSQKEFEDSPLNRVLKQAAPGKDWKLGNGHEIEFDYQSNSGSEVRHYSVNITVTTSNNIKVYTPTLVASSSNNGYYPAGELYKTITKDENHDGTSSKLHTTEEFKDKQGRVVLKRTYALVSSSETTHDTYYVYDDYGNLSYVLPPKVVHDSSISSTELSELCYQYRYDSRSRLVEKKIPGKGWEYIVYNKLDLPVFTQDANLNAQNKWLFTKYDAFGRVAFTGINDSSQSRTAIQNLANNTVTYTQFETKTSSPQTIAGTTVYYTNTAIPHGVDEILTINYYDDYTFDKGSGNSESAYGVTPETDVKGLATGSKVRVLDTNYWITNVTYYDDKSRPILVYSINDYLSYKDKIVSKFDFSGNPLETTSYHFKDGKIIIIEDYYNYDHASRLLSHKQKSCKFPIGEEYLALYPEFIICDPEETIVQNSYDDLGQLVSKGVGGKTTQGHLQNIDYTYNVRGWLKQINNPSTLGNDLFSFKLNYNTENHGATKLFNGNISETEWKTANIDNSLKWYTYGYDALNRITYATNDNGRYNLASSTSPITYDKNGNITFLTRTGHIVESPDATNNSDFGDMDRIYYYYGTKSNELKKVTDFKNDNFGFVDKDSSANDYIYDDNGNMIQDYNKGITNITYNHLNLPKVIDIDGDYTGTISYVYDATGVKLSKSLVEYETPTSTDTETIDYAGNYVYKSTGSHSLVNGNWQGSTLFLGLQYFNHPEGYIEPKSGGFNYVYQYKDHLGNVRLSYSDTDSDGTISEAGIFNDGFESNSGWSISNVSGAMIYDSSFKYSGDYSGKIVKTTSGEKYFNSDTWTSISNTSSTQYTFSGWVYSDNPSVDIVMLKKDGTTTTYDYVRTYTKNQWIYLEKTVTVSSNIDELRLRIDNNGGGTVWFDDVKIRKASSEILEENNYYPFGLKHKGYNTVVNSTNPALKKTYNGKEFQDELDLNWHDYGARNYDAALGRWMNVDPLAEDYYEYSTYNYTLNNPILFVDPDGRGVYWKPDANGNLVAESGDTVASLAKHLNTTKDKAQKMVSDSKAVNYQGQAATGDDEIVVGQTVKVDNNMTRSVKKSDGITVTEAIDKNSSKGANKACDNYICDQASMLAVDGKEITPETANENYGSDPFFNTDNYKKVDSFDGVPFGEGIAVIAGQHVVVNYGKSNDGTQYVYSKDGRAYKPEVKSMNTVLSQMKTTGMINSTKNVQINYYVKK